MNPRFHPAEPALVLFDIDGTLLDSYAFDTELFLRAVQEHTGRRISGDWGAYTHATDSGLLREACPELDAEAVAAIRARFTALTREHLAAQPGGAEGGHLGIPGAAAFVEALLDRRDLRVGVATGGWRQTAELKLRHIGLGDALEVGRLALATATDHYDRAEILRKAQARALNGRTPAHRVYFGDGEWDRRTCAALGVAFVAIGHRVEHAPRFPDFRDAPALLAAAGLA